VIEICCLSPEACREFCVPIYQMHFEVVEG
jgi:hypothetical protein